jgi:hypothetical protein
MRTILKREPVLWQVLVLALINLLVVFNVVHLTDVQLGGLNSALAAVLGFIVRQQVTPLADPRTRGNEPAELVPVEQLSPADPRRSTPAVGAPA